MIIGIMQEGTGTSHPWLEIPLSVYETHMSQSQVGQLSTLNACMKDQLNTYPAKTVTVLGIAGGNGLEHADPAKISTLYGVDINASYLEQAARRHPELETILVPLCLDVTVQAKELARCDLLIADLVVEYLGYAAFLEAVQATRPTFVSVVIQMQETGAFVSESPLRSSFDCLETLLHPITAEGLGLEMSKSAYRLIHSESIPLPNQKRFIRLDYAAREDC
ncbi:MAG: class I SAM-dependent methyltransferase [Sphaerochaeta sp.]|nr:class I SAM-dependent methyltransferase [Sphaerochaeta sp.]